MRLTIVGLMLFAVTDSQCPDHASSTTPIGIEVAAVYVRDANSNRCLRIEGRDHVIYTVVAMDFCAGRDLIDTTLPESAPR